MGHAAEIAKANEAAKAAEDANRMLAQKLRQNTKALAMQQHVGKPRSRAAKSSKKKVKKQFGARGNTRESTSEPDTSTTNSVKSAKAKARGRAASRKRGESKEQSGSANAGFDIFASK